MVLGTGKRGETHLLWAHKSYRGAIEIEFQASWTFQTEWQWIRRPLVSLPELDFSPLRSRHKGLPERIQVADGIKPN